MINSSCPYNIPEGIPCLNDKLTRSKSPDLKRELTLFEVKPGLRIAILNILGDTELVQACAKALGEQLKKVSYDALITAEAKSIPLAYALSVETKKPYIVLRKSYKPYMGDALRAETLVHHHRANRRR